MEDDVDQRQHSSFQLNLTVTTFVCGILFSSTANLSAALCYVCHNGIYASYKLPIQKGNRNIKAFCLPPHFSLNKICFRSFLERFIYTFTNKANKIDKCLHLP